VIFFKKGGNAFYKNHVLAKTTSTSFPEALCTLSLPLKKHANQPANNKAVIKIIDGLTVEHEGCKLNIKTSLLTLKVFKSLSVLKDK
jgi:hypothetical protein